MNEQRKASKHETSPSPVVHNWWRVAAAWVGAPVIATIVFGLVLASSASWFLNETIAALIAALIATAWYLSGSGFRAVIAGSVLVVGSGILLALVFLAPLGELLFNAPLPSALSPPPPVYAPPLDALPSPSRLYPPLLRDAPRLGALAPETLDFPRFPWPPPQASARLVLPSNFFSDDVYLKDVADRLIAAFDGQRYEYSFLYYPHGFALVSRIERINDDATSATSPQRWELDIRASTASLRRLLLGLFTAPEGYFRVIAFVVTDEPFGQTDDIATTPEAQKWLAEGFNVLPAQVAGMRVNGLTRCTSLIYEFRGRGFGETVQVVLPGKFEARRHLEQAGIWRALEAAVQR
jgi:hypothetical protein